MWEHSLAYRDSGGFLKGFVGSGFTKDDAKEDALKQIQIYCKWYAGERFDPANVVESEKGLTKEEMKDLRDQWQWHRLAKNRFKVGG